MSGVGSDWTDLTRHYFAEESKVRSQVDKAARHMATEKEPPHNLTAAARYQRAPRRAMPSSQIVNGGADVQCGRI
jgi:hypothetical protein